LNGVQEVAGSNPAGPSIHNNLVNWILHLVLELESAIKAIVIA